MKNNNKPTHTRTINPKLGFLGFLGILGFTGFLPKMLSATEFMDVPSFFLFFGFFGFYFEGKMSGTMIDERFEFNRNRATIIANKVALVIIFTVSIIVVSSPNRLRSMLGIDIYDILSVLIALIGLCFGLAVFLEQYLLYRFENEE